MTTIAGEDVIFFADRFLQHALVYLAGEHPAACKAGNCSAEREAMVIIEACQRLSSYEGTYFPMLIPETERGHFSIRNSTVERLLNQFARFIDSKIPKGFGFMLLIFEFTPGNSVFYISNAARPTMIQAMREFVKKHGVN